MKNTRVQAYAAIDTEREYQESRWNADTTETAGVHSNLEFLVFIQHYTNEALTFGSRHGDPAARVFGAHNLRKIAALAVAALRA